MRGLRCVLVLLSAVLLVSFAAVAQESPAPGEDADERVSKAQLAERDRFIGEARQLVQAGKLPEAPRSSIKNTVANPSFSAFIDTLL